MKKINLHIFIKVFLVVFFTIFTNINVFSQNLLPNGSFFITEINWDGGWVWDSNTKTYKSNPNDEWFEVYNDTVQSISLDQYSIKGFSTNNKDLILKYPERCVVNPKSYLVVTRLEFSPSLGNSQCVSTNMSISNTNISINIVSKTNTMDLINEMIGDPSKSTHEQFANEKYSIVKKDGSWIKSSNKVFINKLESQKDEYKQYASPNGPDVDTDLKINQTVEYKDFPVINKLVLDSNINQNPWTIEDLSFEIYDSKCLNSLKNIITNEWLIDSPGVYCVIAKADISTNSNLKYKYQTNKIVNILKKQNTIENEQGSVIIPKVSISELDLNEDVVELYNDDAKSWELKDFYLQDLIGSVKKTEIGDSIIEAKSYLTIKVKELGISLNNSGDNILLTYKDTELSRTNAPLKSTYKDYSYQYFKDTDSWETNLATLGSLNIRSRVDEIKNTDNIKNKNITDEEDLKSREIDYFINKIRINEIYPEGEEFVELYNQSSEDIDIDLLEVKDLKGKIKKYIIPSGTVIKSKSILGIKTKKYLNLNNSGDGIQITTSKGDLIDKIEYDKSEGVNSSYQYFSDGWSWEVPSFQEENQKSISSKMEDEIVVETKNNNIENIQKQENCSESILYAQVSKNIFLNTEFKFEIKNLDNQQLPALVKLCDISIGKDIVRVKKIIPKENLNIENLSKQILTDTLQPDSMSIVEYSLKCTGLKTVKIKKENIQIKKTFNSEVEINCVNGKTVGYGFYVIQSPKSILYPLKIKNQIRRNISTSKGNTKPKSITNRTKATKISITENLVNNLIEYVRKLLENISK